MLKVKVKLCNTEYGPSLCKTVTAIIMNI